MGDVVNLKRFKKRSEREQSAKEAEANRARFGRTKSERTLDEQRARARERIAGSTSHRWRGRIMKSPVVKRSIVVAGHKTSVSLEEAFWNGMKEISGLRNMTLSELVGEIDNNRQQGNLSSAIRLFVLDYFKSRAQRRHAAGYRSRTASMRTAAVSRMRSCKGALTAAKRAL